MKKIKRKSNLISSDVFFYSDEEKRLSSTQMFHVSSNYALWVYIVFFIDGKRSNYTKNFKGVFSVVSNRNALSVTVHGYSKTTDTTNMTNDLHLQLVKLQISSWFEWVPSLPNITDLHSRIETIRELTYYQSLDIQEWTDDFQVPSDCGPNLLPVGIQEQ